MHQAFFEDSMRFGKRLYYGMAPPDSRKLRAASVASNAFCPRRDKMATHRNLLGVPVSLLILLWFLGILR